MKIWRFWRGTIARERKERSRSRKCAENNFCPAVDSPSPLIPANPNPPTSRHLRSQSCTPWIKIVLHLDRWRATLYEQHKILLNVYGVPVDDFFCRSVGTNLWYGLEQEEAPKVILETHTTVQFRCMGFFAFRGRLPMRGYYASELSTLCDKWYRLMTFVVANGDPTRHLVQTNRCVQEGNRFRNVQVLYRPSGQH